MNIMKVYRRRRPEMSAILLPCYGVSAVFLMLGLTELGCGLLTERVTLTCAMIGVTLAALAVPLVVWLGIGVAVWLEANSEKGSYNSWSGDRT